MSHRLFNWFATGLFSGFSFLTSGNFRFYLVKPGTEDAG